ncbi:hypothetical protein ACG2OD_14660 [Streptomyces sp. PDY-4]|uniref:hypothetical protein n=1 Tax=Streptomyces sp. PDY-4 TaxID=3376070 RepID=UPI00379D092F
MSEQWNVYRVSFPVEVDGMFKTASMEVSAHPLRSQFLVKHQVWLLLSQWGYDVDPLTGSIEHVGYEAQEADEK